MHRKLWQLLAVLVIGASLLTACGGDNTPTTAPPPPAAATNTTAPAAPAGATNTAAPAAATPAANGAKTPATGNGKPVVVSSKNFTEELIVGEMYALLLEQAGIPVTRKLNLGATDIAQAALVKGDISLYPEYTGTGLLVVLAYTGTTITDPNAVYDMVKTQYEQKYQLTWLDQSPMNDSQGLATTHAVADKYNIKTLSDLSTQASNLILAATPEFQDRPDGLPGLQKTYGGFKFKDVQTFDIGLKYKALLDGKADVAVAFTTDGELAGDNLVTLVDDKNLWPPYHIAPVVRDDVLAANPQIKDILNGLAPKITSDVISGLNWDVDGKKMDYKDVAKKFLVDQGLLKSSTN